MDFNKRFFLGLLALGLFLSLTKVEASTSVIGYGKDTSEAVSAALRQGVVKNFTNKKDKNLKEFLAEEILPKASSFVQSYKVLESKKSSTVAVQAELDLEIVKHLLALSPEAMGEKENSKAVILLRPLDLSNIQTSQDKEKSLNELFEPIRKMAEQRLERRGFAVDFIDNSNSQILSKENLASTEVLKAIGSKAGARLALGITMDYIVVDMEEEKGKQQKIAVSATMIDVSNGQVLTKSTINFSEPRTRRDQYISDMKKLLPDEVDSLFQIAFVEAGKVVANASSTDPFFVLRVKNPDSPLALNKFRELFSAVKDIKSVRDYRIRRGKFDFAVEPVMDNKAVIKALQSIPKTELVVVPIEEMLDDPYEIKSPLITVRIETPKVEIQEGGVSDEIK
ncbi:MAG: hypothetical protein M9962_02850 [Oligoflexia bacterium]|nr:hypothetical protein [Oligoflexia bacterium]